MAAPALYPSRATVTLDDGSRASVLVPFTGALALSLRRRASALLRKEAVDGQHVRAVAITLQPDHLVVSIAGTPPAVQNWIAGGRLARAAAMVVTQAADEADRHASAPTRLARLHDARPVAPPPKRRFGARLGRAGHRSH